MFLKICQDGNGIVEGVGSKLPSKSGINAKIDFLERAEENYYKKQVHEKQVIAA